MWAGAELEPGPRGKWKMHTPGRVLKETVGALCTGPQCSRQTSSMARAPAHSLLQGEPLGLTTPSLEFPDVLKVPRVTLPCTAVQKKALSPDMPGEG